MQKSGETATSMRVVKPPEQELLGEGVLLPLNIHV